MKEEVAKEKYYQQVKHDKSTESRTKSKTEEQKETFTVSGNQIRQSDSRPRLTQSTAISEVIVWDVQVKKLLFKTHVFAVFVMSSQLCL